MAIARVKIAPIEQWCDWYKKPATKNARTKKIASSFVGLTIGIDTESMRDAACVPKARMWNVTTDSIKKLSLLANRISGFAICEHMLEMD